MKIEVWYEEKSYEGDIEGMIRLYIPDLKIVVDPRFAGRVSGKETWDYTQLEAWSHSRPYLIKEEWVYMGEL